MSDTICQLKMPNSEVYIEVRRDKEGTQFGVERLIINSWNNGLIQIGKGVHQSCILSPAYLTYLQSTS